MLLKCASVSCPKESARLHARGSGRRWSRMCRAPSTLGSYRFHVLLVGLLGSVVRRFQELSRARAPCYVVAPKVRRIVPDYEASDSGVVVVVEMAGPKTCDALKRTVVSSWKFGVSKPADYASSLATSKRANVESMRSPACTWKSINSVPY